MNDTELLCLAEQHNTPLYIYNYNSIQKQVKILRNILGKSIQLFYSVKANPNHALINRLAEEVDGFEIASGGELRLAQSTSIGNSNLLFAGPGKTMDELYKAIQSTIGIIVLESVQEGTFVDRIAAQHGVIQRVAVRVNIKNIYNGTKLMMSGKASPFGIDEEIIEESIDALKQLKNIEIVGIYAYFGTQILHAESIANNFNCILTLHEKIQKHMKQSLSFIGLGGGYGIPYFDNEKELDTTVLKSCVEEVLKKHSSHIDKSMSIVSESGRYLVAQSGYFIVKILYIKTSHDKKYYIVDGGTNCYSIAGGMKALLRRNLPVRALNKNTGETEKVTIVGPLCTPTDILAQDIILPKCKQNEYLLFPFAGAYGYSASPLKFLSHEPPNEIIV